MLAFSNARPLARSDSITPSLFSLSPVYFGSPRHLALKTIHVGNKARMRNWKGVTLQPSLAPSRNTTSVGALHGFRLRRVQGLEDLADNANDTQPGPGQAMIQGSRI